MSLQGALMVCGTASDVGKSRLVGGICRLLARRGLAVAPFKAQNMSLNSFVTSAGHEIARSQAHQAAAAGTVPEVAMNPVLLKPTGAMRSQLVVMGRPAGEVTTGRSARRSEALFDTVQRALADLRRRYDVVVAEGAGGAAEINLLHADIGNLPLAARAQVPALLVGDIERGGVFASLYGTYALLPPELASCLAGFVINKFRGDERLLSSGIAELTARTGLPCLGVLPHLGPLVVDAEDSLALEQRPPPDVAPAEGDVVDVAVVRLPHLANFTDFDPLVFEPGVRLRYVAAASGLGEPDLVVLPGSKATVDDLGWLRRQGLDAALLAAVARGSCLLAVCGGYQMLGRRIDDDVESKAGAVRGLGVAAVTTSFASTKTTRQRHGRDAQGTAVDGYEIRHGTPVPDDAVPPWLFLDDGGRQTPEGICQDGVWATSLHGILESDGLRRSVLQAVAERRGKRVVAAPEPFESHRQREIDQVAEALAAHLDVERLGAVIAAGRGR